MPAPGSSSNTSTAEQDAAKAMPPPPLPIQPAPIILGQEVEALAGCIKNAMVATGQIYGFLAESHNLKIASHVSLPHSLSSKLGREVEKYDQLCDSMESYLLRAVAVLQREIRKEQARLKEEEHAAAKQIKLGFTVTVPEPATTDSGVLLPQPTPTSSPPTNPPGSSGRRPSVISISSLHRPPFPLKLDLSAPSMRITADEAASLFGTSLASPVTLAPKSARPLAPGELPADLVAAFASASSTADPTRVDIDLTVPNPTPGMIIDVVAGSSADKPIELDLVDGMALDMNDLFGDANEGTSGDANVDVDGLFSPLDETGSNPMAASEGDQKPDANFLSALGVRGGPADHEDIFHSLSQGSANSGMKPPVSGLHSAPSPNTILEGFSSTMHATNLSHQTSGTTADQSFDIHSLGLPNLSPNIFGGTHQDVVMNFDVNTITFDSFLGMSGPSDTKDLSGELKPTI